jgi:uncharacterized protein (TIGR02996 family)
MDTLNAFLQSIVATPQASDGTWLVLADWLEENDPDPRRAELLRLHRRLLDTCCEPDSHPRRGEWQARLVELLARGVRPCVPQRTIRLGKNLGMTFTWIPPGTFLMGSPAQEPNRNNDETQHQVTLTKGYYLGIHPVTQAQWQAVMGEVLPVGIGGWENFHGENLPVEVEYWDGCQDFCTKLGERTGTPFRLPTEAEWEHACRAGTTTPFWCGETLSPAQANHFGPYGPIEAGASPRKTTAVETFPPNPWGLFDMHSNVWEWCQDYYDREFYRNTNTKDPVNRNEAHRWHVLRGGSLTSYSSHCRSANRQGDDAAAHGHYTGLRVVAGTAGVEAADPG